MATLGIAGGGTNGFTLSGTDCEAYLIGQMTEAGNLTSVSIDCNSSGTNAVAVYKGTSSAPGAKIASTTITASASHAYVTVSVSGALALNDYIWIAMVTDGSTTFTAYKNGTSGTNGRLDYGVTYPTFNDPFSAEDAFGSNQLAAYITYTVAGGGSKLLTMINNQAGF